MSRCTKTENKARQSSTSLSFSDLCYLAECHGFVLGRITGSHHIYRHPDLPQILLNFQPVKGGKAKPYQVKQLLKHIDYLMS